MTIIINSVDRVMTPSRTAALAQRLLLALLLALALTLMPTPVGSVATAAPSNQEFLLVSDPAAEALYVYRGSDHRRTGRLDGVALSTHAGTLQMPNGHVIAIDDKAGRVVELRISATGRPAIVASADIPGAWTGAAWASADPRLRYFAVAGGSEEAPTITVVDLRTFAVHQIAVEPQPDASDAVPETQVYLAGRPLQLVYTTGGKFHTVPLQAILRDQRPTITSTAPVGPATHGPVISRNGDTVFSTTADGLDGASIRGASLSSPFGIAYSATYRRIVGTVALPTLSDGPVAGSPARDTESRFSAINPSGGTVYVSNGGDGTISVVDSQTRRIAATITTPSPLTGGGYLTVIARGTAVTDLFAR